MKKFTYSIKNIDSKKNSNTSFQKKSLINKTKRLALEINNNFTTYYRTGAINYTLRSNLIKYGFIPDG